MKNRREEEKRMKGGRYWIIFYLMHTTKPRNKVKTMGVKVTPSYNWGGVGGQCPLAKLFIHRTSGVVGGWGGGDSGSMHNGFSSERDWYLGKPSV